jgi:hypothetical protein
LHPYFAGLRYDEETGLVASQADADAPDAE